jgi:hypothetical protein
MTIFPNFSLQTGADFSRLPTVISAYLLITLLENGFELESSREDFLGPIDDIAM